MILIITNKHNLALSYETVRKSIESLLMQKNLCYSTQDWLGNEIFSKIVKMNSFLRTSYLKSITSKSNCVMLEQS